MNFYSSKHISEIFASIHWGMTVSSTIQEDKLGKSFFEMYTMNGRFPDTVDFGIDHVSSLVNPAWMDSSSWLWGFCGVQLILVMGLGFWIFLQYRSHQKRLHHMEASIQDQNRLQERVLYNEMLLRYISEKMPVMLVAVHSSGHIVYWNHECERITGYSLDEVMGNPSVFTHLFPDETERRHLTEEWLEHRKELNGQELTIVCKNGQRKTLSVSALIDGTAQSAQFYWVMGMDITGQLMAEEQQRKFENKMRNLQKLDSLGVLSGGLAHDFNNLLMGILGNTELARMEIDSDSPIQTNLNGIDQAAKRAAELCHKMLTYAGKSRLHIQPLHLKHFMEELYETINKQLPPQIELRVSSLESLYIQADAERVREVLLCLVENAIEAIGHENGVISIKTGVMQCDSSYLSETWIDESLEPGSYGYIEISDTGCGIEETELHSIFDPFFSTKFLGRGLGLPAVLGIVRGHHGALKVYSEPGEGTTFKILLPLHSHDQVLESQGQNAKPFHGNGLILVVDDEPALCLVGKGMLEKAGFTVIIANSGIEAIERYQSKQQNIRCILLDYIMPDLSGDKVLKKIRTLNPSVPVILSSGYNKEIFSDEILRMNYIGFIQKPYSSQALYNVLGELLNTAEN